MVMNWTRSGESKAEVARRLGDMCANTSLLFGVVSDLAVAILAVVTIWFSRVVPRQKLELIAEPSIVLVSVSVVEPDLFLSSLRTSYSARIS